MTAPAHPPCPADDGRVAHAGCAFDNAPLTALVEDLARHDPLPHCGLSHLIDGLFLVPVSPGGGNGTATLQVEENGLLRLFTSEATFRQTVPAAGTHVHVMLRSLLEEGARQAGGRPITCLEIVRAAGRPVVIEADLIAKLRHLAAGQHGQPAGAAGSPGTAGPAGTAGVVPAAAETAGGAVDIPAGETLVISPPDPPAPPEFLEHLRQVFGPAPAVAAVYLFDTAFGGAETSLIIGVLPAPGRSREEVDGLWPAAMAGVEGSLHDRACLDFLILDDPELVEVVTTTVEPLSIR